MSTVAESFLFALQFASWQSYPPQPLRYLSCYSDINSQLANKTINSNVFRLLSPDEKSIACYSTVTSLHDEGGQKEIKTTTNVRAQTVYGSPAADVEKVISYISVERSRTRKEAEKGK